MKYTHENIQSILNDYNKLVKKIEHQLIKKGKCLYVRGIILSHNEKYLHIAYEVVINSHTKTILESVNIKDFNKNDIMRLKKYRAVYDIIDKILILTEITTLNTSTGLLKFYYEPTRKNKFAVILFDIKKSTTIKASLYIPENWLNYSNEQLERAISKYNNIKNYYKQYNEIRSNTHTDIT